jgi:hypothetical protein
MGLRAWKIQTRRLSNSKKKKETEREWGYQQGKNEGKHCSTAVFEGRKRSSGRE